MRFLAEISYPPIPIWEVGPLRLSLHGLFAAIGFLVGAQYAVKRANRRGLDGEAFQSILTWALVGAIIGARYFTAPAAIADGTPLLDALNPINGNFSILGGMAGGIIAAAWRSRMLRQPVWALFDSASFGLAIGTIIGRVGDLLIVEHLGSATDFAFGYGIKPGYDVAPQHDPLECTAATAVDGLCGVYHHAAAYDMLGAAVLLVVLFWIYRRWQPRHYGQMFAFWVMWYGFQRFLIDFTRLVPADQSVVAQAAADRTLGALTWSQWSGIGAGLLGIFMIWRFRTTQPVVTELKDRALAAAAGRPRPDDEPSGPDDITATADDDRGDAVTTEIDAD